MLVLTKFEYLDQEKELAPKRHDNIDYILSCCVYDLEIVLAKMKDKPITRMVGISPEALNLKALMTELYAHDTMEPELVANLARRFGETFEDKYTDQQWKGAYDVEEITDNINPLYFMMRGEAIATYKLAEEQAP
uniref:Uncharacterized protein n=1 Tax=Romanomermis culicivorax TaxID=13658 RepID=A0A915I1Z8_ROMCU